MTGLRSVSIPAMADESLNDLSPVLSKVVQRSGALTVLLVTREGITVAAAGDTSYLDTTAMAALVAGMFSATREVARLVGEKQFSILLQQGETRHIHISLIRDTTMLVIIFEDLQRIGLVRLEARKAGEDISRWLSNSDKPAEESKRLDTVEFKEYAFNLIDRIFQPR